MPRRLSREVAELDTFARDENQRAVALLEDVLRRRGFTVRAAEREAGFGQGTLHAVLAGRSALRFYHVAAICQAVGFPLSLYYRELAATLEGAPTLAPEEVVPGLSEDELLEEVRALIRRHRKV